jgi:hypothetical protein
MAVGDEKLAMQKAQEAWQRTFDEAKQRFTEGVTAAGLTGTYQGADTLAKQQQLWSQGFQERGQQQAGALSLLQLQAGLQGPKDWARYAQLSQSTPGGLQDALRALAGNYQIAGSQAQGTPGPATLQSRIGDLTSTTGGAPTQATGQGAGDYALRSPNQFNLASWSALPTSQKAMVTGLYGAAGYDENDFLQALQNAAPRYSGPSAGTLRY